MSEQIREQISAFLDGELPSSETELLLKRLTRDCELRQSFGRYALIGETLRGSSQTRLSRSFAARLNRAIDGEPVAPGVAGVRVHPSRWWKPIAGTAVAAGVAAMAVVALQQRALSPSVHAARPMVAQNARVLPPREAISYTVPAAAPAETMAAMPAARLTSYVFAHSKYSFGLGQGNLLSALLSDDQLPAADAHPVNAAGAGPAAHAARVNGVSLSDLPAQQPQRDTHIAP